MANALKRFCHFRLFSLFPEQTYRHIKSPLLHTCGTPITADSIRNPDSLLTYKAKPGACFVWA